MPFDPDQYLASKQDPAPSPGGGFDPDAYLKSKQAEAPGIGERALGLLGSAAHGIDSVTGAPMRAAIGAAQNANEPGDILPDAWKAAKEQFANTDKEAPSGEQIAERAGVPHGTISKVAGFGMDMAANPLNFMGPVAKLGGKAIGGISNVTGAAEKLKSFANEKALKAAGAMTKDFNMIHDKDMADSLGSFLLDNKMVTPLATVSKVAERLEEAKETAGKTIGHILDTSDAAHAPRLSASEIALSLSEDPEIAGLGKVPGKEGTARQINNYIETLYKNGDNLTLREAQKLRQGIDESINFNKKVPEMAGAQPYLYKMRDAISQKMNDAVNTLDSTTGGEAVNRLKEANLAYSKLATLDKIAENRLGALSSNRAISLTDTMAGLAGAMAGHSPLQHAALGAGAALANKAGRTFGPGMMATGANALSQGIAAAPGMLSSPALGIAGPAGGAITGLLNRTAKK